MRALAESGDIDTANARAAYQKKVGSPTSLTEDQLLQCFASQSDDFGDEDIVNRMVALQNGKELNWESEQR